MGSRDTTTNRIKVDLFHLRLFALLVPVLAALAATRRPAPPAADWGIALGLAASLVAIAVWQVRRRPGLLAARLTVATVAAAFCALLVHFSGIREIAHFYSITALTLLVCYRDWRPVALCGTLIAVEYAAAFFLRHGGWPIAIFTGPEKTVLTAHLASIASASTLFGYVAKHIGTEEEAIRRMAYIDVLTGLPNRRHFQETLRQALRWTERCGGRLAVFYLDLDRFKQVNDAFGHATGDRLLQVSAARMTATLRDGDTVARLGGDEFAVILNNLNRRDDAICVADKIMATLSLPVSLNGSVTEISASLGIALYPDHARDMENLLHRADEALYCAKQAGRNTYRVFAP